MGITVAEWVILAVAGISATAAIFSAWLTSRGNETMTDLRLKVANLEGQIIVITQLLIKQHNERQRDG